MNAIIGMTDLALAHPAHAAAARVRADRQRVGRGAARRSSTTSSTSRRSRRAGWRSTRRRSASATRWRTPSGCSRRARTRRGSSSPATSARTCPTRSSAIRAACADHPQPGRQRDQVHRRRRGRRGGRGRQRDRRRGRPAVHRRRHRHRHSHRNKHGRSSARSCRPTRPPRAATAAPGSGLTISSQLVEMMGGRIWIESEVGRGSQFHFVAAFRRAAARRTPRAGRRLPTCTISACSSSTTTPPTARSCRRCWSSWQMQPTGVDERGDGARGADRGRETGPAVSPGAHRCADARRGRLHARAADCSTTTGWRMRR